MRRVRDCVFATSCAVRMTGGNLLSSIVTIRRFTVLIQFSLNAADMNRACRRLGETLAHKTKCGNDAIAFNIASRCVEITANGASEGLAAEVQREGRASIPRSVLHGVIKTLPYFGRRNIEFGFSEGRMHVDSMVFHHKMIVLSDSAFPQRGPSFRKRAPFSSQAV